MDTHRPKQARPLPDPNPFPPSALSAALTALQCLNSLYAPPVARLSPIALRDVKPDRGNPPQSPEEGEIEYNTYGWFNFDSDAEGVRRLDGNGCPRTRLLLWMPPGGRQQSTCGTKR